MIRWLVSFIVLASVLCLVRVVVIALCERAQRRRYAAELNVPALDPQVEHALGPWRDALGRRLWIRLVGLPLAAVITLALVGNYS